MEKTSNQQQQQLERAKNHNFKAFLKKYLKTKKYVVFPDDFQLLLITSNVKSRQSRYLTNGWIARWDFLARYQTPIRAVHGTWWKVFDSYEYLQE